MKPNNDTRKKEHLFVHMDTDACPTESPKKTRLFIHVNGETTRSKRLFEVVDGQNSTLQLPSTTSDLNENMTTPLSVPCQNSCDIPALPTKSVVSESNPASPVETVITECIGEEWRNFELRLLEKIRKVHPSPEGEKCLIQYRFQVAVLEEIFETVVDSREVPHFQWVRDATEGKAVLRKGVKSSMSFDEYVSTILTRTRVPEKLFFAINGWKKIDGKCVYVHGSGVVGNFLHNIFGNTKMKLEYDQNTVGTPEIFSQAMGMLNICEDRRITLPLLLFTHIGALTTLFDKAGCPVKFVLAVIGETNSRKTSLSVCMTKTFNRRDIYKPDTSFSSTAAGIEKTIGTHADSVIVIDDFMPAETKTKQNALDSKLEMVLRMYGDRKGIDRMTDFAKNPEAGYYSVRGVAVITGEHIRGVQSSLTRCVMIKVNRTSVDDSSLAFYQEHPLILNTHIHDFLTFVTVNFDWTVEFIRTKFKGYRAENLFDIPRHNEGYAVLMTAVETLLAYAESRTFLSHPACEEYACQWKAILQDLFRQNELSIKQTDWQLTFAQICETIIADGCSPLPKEERKDYGDAVFDDGHCAYIRPEPFLQKSRSLLSLWGIECPNFSKKWAFDILENSGMIETTGREKGRRSLKLPGCKMNQQRFLCLRKIRVKEILNKYTEKR